jgi:hypothetical protein
VRVWGMRESGSGREVRISAARKPAGLAPAQPTTQHVPYRSNRLASSASEPTWQRATGEWQERGRSVALAQLSGRAAQPGLPMVRILRMPCLAALCTCVRVRVRVGDWATGW